MYAFAIIEKNDDGSLAEVVGIKGGGNWAVSADVLDVGKTGLIANLCLKKGGRSQQEILGFGVEQLT